MINVCAPVCACVSYIGRYRYVYPGSILLKFPYTVNVYCMSSVCTCTVKQTLALSSLFIFFNFIFIAFAKHIVMSNTTNKITINASVLGKRLWCKCRFFVDVFRCWCKAYWRIQESTKFLTEIYVSAKFCNVTDEGSNCEYSCCVWISFNGEWKECTFTALSR